MDNKTREELQGLRMQLERDIRIRATFLAHDVEMYFARKRKPEPEEAAMMAQVKKIIDLERQLMEARSE